LARDVTPRRDSGRKMKVEKSDGRLKRQKHRASLARPFIRKLTQQEPGGSGAIYFPHVLFIPTRSKYG
jgi:hypothetical protein